MGVYARYHGCLVRGTDTLLSLVVKTNRLNTCLFYRSGLPPPILAHRLRQTRRLSIRHRGRTQCRVRPKRMLGTAIFMRAFSTLSILTWVTFKCLWNSIPFHFCAWFLLSFLFSCACTVPWPGHIRTERLCPDCAHLLTHNSAYWAGRR
jgi:hypothetical protein